MLFGTKPLPTHYGIRQDQEDADHLVPVEICTNTRVKSYESSRAVTSRTQDAIRSLYGLL